MDDSSIGQRGWEGELFHLLVDITKDYAVFVIDFDGRVLTWNPGVQRVLGYSESEIVGESFSIFFTPEDRALGIPEAEIQLSITDGRASDDRWHVRKDGSLLWVSGVMTLLRDESGQARACAKVMRDYTGAKLAADALRESESRLRVALDAAQMGTWLWRIPTDEQILDDSLRRLMGLSPDEKVMTLDHFLKAVHPEDSERVRAEFERCLKEDGGFNVEFRVRWSDGSLHWLRDQGKMFNDEAGNPLFMTGACVDITVRKHDEEELREADQKKDQFLALLAHELRNPLAPLRNGLQVMRLADDEKKVAEIRDMMERQLSHMVRLIDDLLDVSRLSQNKLHLQKTPVLLAEVIGNSIESARPAIEAADHKISVTLPTEPIYLDADLTRLAQVFSNLLTNSAKYTERGGHIWVSAESRENAIEVSVRDDGIGIPADALFHIFDMFSQVDRSIERTTGGLGIGLALVKGIVEMHGGKIHAWSDGPGLGSTFKVTLPLSRQRADSTYLPAETEIQPADTRRKVLVVDDNRDSAKSMAALLRLLGHEVQTANDGIEAIDLAKQFQPDVILMDVGMPKLNGYDATQQIRKQPWGQKIVILALTGWGQEADRERSRDAQCDGHLVKPVNLSDLSKLLSTTTRDGRHSKHMGA
jgi:two-component system CheB/CheR fusion protein